MDRSDDSTIRFTVSLSGRMLAELDRRVTATGYASRSEFIRDLIRDRIVKERWREGKNAVVGVLTIGYDHHQRGLTQKIMEIQHGDYVHILCTTHVHLDHHHCLEAIIMRGRPREIETIRARLEGLRGVKFAKLSRASKVEL